MLFAITLSSREYWSHPETWRFLLGTPVLALKETLHDAFASNPFPRAVKDPVALFGLSTAATLPLAVVSWHCVGPPHSRGRTC